MKVQSVVLTDIGPFRHTAGVKLLAEVRLVVVDVVQFDGELGLRLQLQSGPFVHHGGSEDVETLLLAIQAACGV